MGWAALRVDQGAVNSRPANSLVPGEFVATTGVRYAAGSPQLHSDVTWVDTQFQPTDAGALLDTIGPFYLSFESVDDDWLMIVTNALQGRHGFVGGIIAFAKADGSQAWTFNSERLQDNAGRSSAAGGDSVTQASLAHWGDRYYLATDQGNVEISPPTGTGPPTVTRLGVRVPEGLRYNNFTQQTNNNPSDAMLLIGSGGTLETWLGADTGDVTWSGSNTNLDNGNVVSIYLTEFSEESGKESHPIWYFDEIIDSGNGALTVTMPGAFINADSTSFRAYFKFWAATTAEFPVEMRTERELVTRYQAALVGASSMMEFKSVGSIFNFNFVLAQTAQFPTVGPGQITNPLPVIAADNARLIFRAYRSPNTSSIVAIWNDSLVMGDSGYNDGDDPIRSLDPGFNEFFDSGPSYRKAVSIPTIIRYSPAGEPWNQPDPYFMNFASDKEDDIKGLIVVNDRLVILCDNAVHTVRYLPFNNLLSSQQGRVKDVITTSVGCPSPKAFTKVETGSGEFVVWLSHRGLEWSDGSGWADACPDFVIPEGADFTRAVMINNAELYRVELFLGLEHYSFYYHPEHMKNQQLKMLGPTPLVNLVTGAAVYRDKMWRMEGSTVKVTQAGNPDNAAVTTGHIRGDSPYQDIEITDLGLTHGPVDGTIKLRPDAAVRGQPLSSGIATNLPNPELDETGSTGVGQRGNYIQVRMDIEGASEGWAVGPLWLKGDEQGGSNG